MPRRPIQATSSSLSGRSLLLLAALSGACQPSVRSDLDQLALRVDSMALAITVLEQRAGLTDNSDDEILTVTTSAAGGLREGSESAPFVLVEFTDYYCPYCATFAISALPDILAVASDLQVVVRNYAISQIHPDGVRVASIVECVADTAPDQAWAMHDRLFARQSSLDSTGIDAVLKSFAVPGCGPDTELHQRVESDLREAERLQLRGTPALILGRRVTGDSVTGVLLSGAYPAAEVLRLLDSMRVMERQTPPR